MIILSSRRVNSPSAIAFAAAIGVAVAGMAFADDCGHPPKMHTCTDGHTRIRMNLQENVATSPLTSSAAAGTPSLLFEVTWDNPTCTTTHESQSWSSSYTNGYKVGAALQTGIETQVGVSSTQWAPIAAEAKLKASSAVTITGELQRIETFTASGTTGADVRCAKHTVKIYRAIKIGTAEQTFVDRVTCNIQGGTDPMTTDCNVRVVKAKSDGTQQTEVQHSETPYNCDCPPDNGDS